MGLTHLSHDCYDGVNTLLQKFYVKKLILKIL